MKKYLSISENSQPKALINEEKLKFFISKVSTWDHFGITENTYKPSIDDEKPSIDDEKHSIDDEKKNMLNR